MPADSELVLAARGGDRGAFAAIYDRYADRIYDFCSSVLRDRDEAADATQDTFLLAAQHLDQLREPDRLRAWLYAIARHSSIRRGRALVRVAPVLGAAVVEVAADGATPDEVAAAGELQQLVWDAADGLSPRDRAILDLQLRQGLDGQELADALGVETAHAYVLTSRLRDQVERSLGALLVARLGREECPDLRALLRDWDGRFDPLIRKRVARHVDGCDVCGEKRRGLVSPLALLAAVPLTPAPAALRDRVLGKVELVSSSSSGGGDWWPPPIDSQPLRRRMLLPAVVAALVALILGVAIAASSGDDAEPLLAGGGSTTTSARRPGVFLPRGTTTSTTSLASATTVPSPGTTPRSGTTVAPIGTPTTPTTTGTPATTTTTTRAPRSPSVTATAAATHVRADACSPDRTTVDARVTADAPLATVILRWRLADDTPGSRAMQLDSGTWSATLGPFANAGTITWWVQATDSAGRTGVSPNRTLTVDPCPAPATTSTSLPIPQ